MVIATIRKSAFQVVVALLCALIAIRARAAAPVLTSLDNGLQLAVIQDIRAPIATARVYVRTGSMYEAELMGSGISHLLEHVLSVGATQKRSEAEGRALLQSIGGQMNAYTTNDHTCFHITALNARLDVALDLLSDWVLNATIPQDEFDREMAVVKQEIGTRRIEPQVLLYETLLERMFLVHPYRFRVIGYEEVLSRVTREDVLDYYHRMYMPNNMLLVVAGNVDAAAVKELAGKTFGKFARGAQPVIVLPQEPPQLAEREVVLDQPVSVGYLAMGFRTIPLSDPDLYALDLADFILSRGPSSRLVRKLRDEKRLVETIDSWSYTPGWDAGHFDIVATTDPAKAQEARGAILEELKLLAATPPPEEEMRRAKKQKLAEREMAIQTVAGEAENLSSDILEAHDPHFTDRYVERIQTVTAEEVRAAAAKYFTSERLTTIVMAPPPANPEETAQPTQAPVETVKKIELKNGLRVLLKRNASIPLVAVQAYFMGGVRVETEADNGVSFLMANLLLRGTATRSAEVIAQSLDDIGATLGAASGNNTFYVRGECLANDLPAFLDIFADVIMNPVFVPTECEIRRELQLAALAREKDDLQETATRFLRLKFYPDSAYRLMPMGTPASVGALQRRQIVDYHRRYCVPNNMVLAIFGDIDVERTTALIEQQFGAFTPNPDLKLPPPAAPVKLDKDARFDETVSKEKTMVYVAYPGMTFGDVQDRAGMYLCDSILSGVDIPSGRIYEELRQKGLAYEASALNWVGVDPGFFAFYAVTNPNQVEDVLDVIRKDIAAFLAALVEARELTSAKDNCATAEVTGLQTNADQAGDAALNELYGLGYDFTPKFLQALGGMTPETVQQIAQKYLTRSVTVVVGPGTEVKEPPTAETK